MSGTNSPAGDGSQPETIHSALSDALSQWETDNTDEGGEGQAGGAGERPRGPDGKFVSAKGAAAEGEAEAGADGAAEPEDGAAAAPEDKAKGAEKDSEKAPDEGAEGEDKPAADPEKEHAEFVARATARWSAADKAKLAGMQPDDQKFVIDRFKSMEADYTRKTQAVAELKREYEPIDQMFQPWKAQMSQAGYTPSSLIKAWASVEQELMSGDPRRQLRVVRDMVAQYRIDPRHVGAVLGLQAPTAARTAASEVPGAGAAAAAGAGGAATPAAPGAPDVIPPGMLPWVREVQGISQHLKSQAEAEQRRAQVAQQQAMQRINDQVQEFRSATDDKGAPAHPFFDEVETDMAVLARAAKARGEQPSLDELYERAVYANPSTRAKQLAAVQTAQRAKEAEEARAKAARARRAGASVTGAPGAGQTPRATPKQDGSIREALEAALDDQG